MPLHHLGGGDILHTDQLTITSVLQGNSRGPHLDALDGRHQADLLAATDHEIG